MSRILFWDLETSPIIAAVWGLYQQDIRYENVIQDWHIICGAWKWLGDDKIHSIACKGTDDKNVIQKLHGVISSADAIVAHNGDNFDWKKFMARVIHHGLPPLKKPVTIDTLKQARKVGFTSRRLDDLGKSLNLGRKIDVERGLWLKATTGDQKAIKALEAYCKGDIPPLENLYLLLRPHMETSLNMGLFHDKPACPKCKSEKMTRQGSSFTRTGKRQQWQCQSCGSWATTRFSEKGAFFK